MKRKLFTATLLALPLLGLGCNMHTSPAEQSSLPTPIIPTATPARETTNDTQAPTNVSLLSPITDGLSRVTKKFFGTYVTPTDSPVSPERFTGYHTGIDFEITADEQTTDVTITAVCDGKLIYKNWVSGYGGIAVQSCTLDGKNVTLLYGHVSFASIAKSVGNTLNAGDTIGILGKGYSSETDGERKHLHFAMHKGSAIELRGYVQTRHALDQWIDPLRYLSKH